MSIIYLLLPLAILLAAVALLGFIWAARSGQLKDLDTPARRVVFDDEPENMEIEKNLKPEKK